MPVHIHSLERRPVHHVRVLQARPGGGRESVLLPVHVGVVDGLPEGLAALVCASDLQSVAPDATGALELSSVRVVDELAALAEDGVVPPLSRCGALLAGDLFSAPDAMKRGGFGDVGVAWRAFHERCAWVAGVAGNHDDVSAVPRGVRVLDAEVQTCGGLRVGGVGLISGDPRRPGRRLEVDQLAAVELVAQQQPDVVVLHEGPGGDAGQRGHPCIPLSPALTVCGHVHWEEPWFRHADGDVLNVDGRVVVLCAR